MIRHIFAGCVWHIPLYICIVKLIYHLFEKTKIYIYIFSKRQITHYNWQNSRFDFTVQQNFFYTLVCKFLDKISFDL